MKMNGQGGSRMLSGKWSAHFCRSKELPDFVVVVLLSVSNCVINASCCYLWYNYLNNIESLLNKN